MLAEGGRYYGQIGFIVFLLFFTSLLSRLVGILHSRINPVITARIVYDLQTMVFSAMQRLSLSFYNNQQTGALMNRVTADARTLQNFFHDIIPFYFTNMLTLIGISVIVLLRLETNTACFDSNTNYSFYRSKVTADSMEDVF